MVCLSPGGYAGELVAIPIPQANLSRAHDTDTRGLKAALRTAIVYACLVGVNLVNTRRTSRG
jgi:hypothetical protein